MLVFRIWNSNWRSWKFWWVIYY